MTEKHIYWVGPRKTDIEDATDFNFYGSITLFGDGKDNNCAFCSIANKKRINHNVTSKEEDAFFCDTVKKIRDEDKDSYFYFYNPNAVYTMANFYEECYKGYENRFYCVNEGALMAELRDKKNFYAALRGKQEEGVISLLTTKEFHRYNCDYPSLLEKFGCHSNEKKRFIFQATVASGGSGTYVVGEDNIDEVVSKLTDDNYILSVYREHNTPVNIHAIIFDDEILLSPGSIQIMKEDANRLLYRGADFLAYNNISEHSRKHFEESVRAACEVFQAKGFRGICGIDGIICNENTEKEEVLLLEINNRFQASSGLINKACKEANFPSLQQINHAAFTTGWKEEYTQLKYLKVGYSNYFFIDNGSKEHSDHFLEIARKEAARFLNKDGVENEQNLSCVVRVEEDGYQKEQTTNSLAYLYRVVFNTNITALDVNRRIHVHENIAEPNTETWFNKIKRPLVNTNDMSLLEKRDYYLRLKIAMLVQGIVIDKDTQTAIDAAEGIRVATNNAVDLRIDVPWKEDGVKKYLIINTPVMVKFVEFAPFKLTHEKGADGKNIYKLYYYSHFLTNVRIYPKDTLGDRKIPDRQGNEIKYKEVAFLSTDRLRVHISNNCRFKIKGEGCQFCNITGKCGHIDLSVTEKVVEDYCQNAKGLKHFLVGGQTAEKQYDDDIIKVIEIIRRHARFAPIYAMLIPYDNSFIKRMCDAGLTQLAFNIEIFDDELAKKYMPGKRSGTDKNTKDDYIQRLEYATTLLGRRGNVRSMLIVGLEPEESLVKGCEELATRGIQPILSIFRPLPHTPLDYMNPPSMHFLFEAYKKIADICKKNNLRVGPECINCQNNTLALPRWLEE